MVRVGTHSFASIREIAKSLNLTFIFIREIFIGSEITKALSNFPETEFKPLGDH